MRPKARRTSKPDKISLIWLSPWASAFAQVCPNFSICFVNSFGTDSIIAADTKPNASITQSSERSAATQHIIIISWLKILKNEVHPKLSICLMFVVSQEMYTPLSWLWYSGCFFCKRVKYRSWRTWLFNFRFALASKAPAIAASPKYAIYPPIQALVHCINPDKSNSNAAWKDCIIISWIITYALCAIKPRKQGQNINFQFFFK